MAARCVANYYIVEMVLLSLYCIVACVQFYISIIALYRISTANKKSNGTVLLRISQWIFFVSAIIFCICRIFMTTCYCFIPKYHPAAFSAAYLSYMLHLGGLLLLLYSRLRDVFSETLYAISNCSKYSFWGIMFLLLSTGGFLLTGDYGLELAMIALCIFIVLITAQVLTWTFVYKLYSIRKVDASSAKVFDVKFLAFLRKYAVLSIICVMFTTTYSIVATISAVVGYGYYWSQVLSVIIVGDVFVDSICMLLSRSEYDKHYYCLCSICDKYCPCLMCMKPVNNINEINIQVEMNRVASKTMASELDEKTGDMSPRSVSSL